ncbi:MAG: GAF domain-containing protein [Deltaproteobacteria bacterium]|nr:GAF domain-containing protein [Deltaproteobacteria bacterium]
MLCSILLPEPNEDKLRYYSAPSLPEGYISAIDPLSIGACCGSCGTAVYRKEAVIVPDIANDPLWAERKEIALKYGIKACWSTPIFSTNGDVLETYAMYYHEPRNPSTSDLELIKIATHIAGISIEHKRTEETLWANLAQLAKKSRYETIVNSVTQSVHKSINLQEVLENAFEVMSTNIDGVEHVAIHLVEGEEAVIKAYRGHQDWFVERVKRLPYPKGFTWKTIIEGKLRYCPDVDEDTVIGPAGKEAGTKSYLSMPIFWEGKAIGCTNVHSFKKNAFEEEELKLLEIVAHQIEVAINNAKQAEALQQSEERYRTLFNQSPVGVYIFKTNCTITHCNERMVRILQSSYDKIIGADLRKLKNNCVLPLMDKVLVKQPATYEGFYEATNSSARLWVSIRLSPLRDAHRNVIGGMAVVEDTTERKKMEEKLIKAQKLESLGILAGGIAHDFNNLLTAILGNISVTKMYVSPEDKIYKRLGEAEKACIRTKDLTQRLLTFSRGGAPIKKVVSSLGELIRDTASFAVSGSKVRCEFLVDKELWPVEIDEGQISQVINNLVINADQAMPYGGVIKIKIKNALARNEEGVSLNEERYLKISIEDNGVGIGKEYLPRVFAPYFTTKQKGSGLGLTTVYSIIKNHDGYIGVESELGVGTKFTIYLPATKGEEVKNGEERDRCGRCWKGSCDG